MLVGKTGIQSVLENPIYHTRTPSRPVGAGNPFRVQFRSKPVATYALMVTRPEKPSNAFDLFRRSRDNLLLAISTTAVGVTVRSLSRSDELETLLHVLSSS